MITCNRCKLTGLKVLVWVLTICLCVGVTSCTAHQVYREWQPVMEKVVK